MKSLDIVEIIRDAFGDVFDQLKDCRGIVLLGNEKHLVGCSAQTPPMFYQCDCAERLRNHEAYRSTGTVD